MHHGLPRALGSRALPVLLLTGLLMTSVAQAGVPVYVLNSGNSAADTALVNLLTANGHTVTLGVEYTAFDGTQNLSGIRTVYLQSNYNWTPGDMPVAGQTALASFVNAGGGMVTNEWTLWKSSATGSFSTLAPLFPVVPTSTFDGAGTATFTRTTANSTLDAGLPSSFSTALESISGTETQFTTLRPGAVAFYGNGGFIGVAGGTSGAGRVLSFNTVNAQLQVADPNFGRLLSNSMNWAANASVASSAPEPGVLALFVPGAFLLFGVRRYNGTKKGGSLR